MSLLIILLVAGLFLIGAEIFVPGGILGVMGAVALLIAVGIGYSVFGSQGGSLLAASVIGMVGIAIVVWIKIFPRTPLGRKMTLSNDLSSASSSETGLNELMGKQGITQSDLRPGGYAIFDGRRVDVISRGDMISRDTTVEVVQVEGNRVVVASVPLPPTAEKEG